MNESEDFSLIDEVLAAKQKLPTLRHCTVQTCVQASVRVRVTVTRAKQLDICLQFPSGYPTAPILLELKSKSLPEKFLDAICAAFEAEKAAFVGRAQIVPVVRFVLDYVEANPLCVCAREIADAKKQLYAAATSSAGDFFKVRQKLCLVHFRCERERYFFEAKVTIPFNYPDERVTTEAVGGNFPKRIETFLLAQAAELARQCVEPPLLRRKKGQKEAAARPAAPFVKRPSLPDVLAFLIGEAKRYPTEPCAICARRCLPAAPSDVVDDAEAAAHVERVYCGHLFHHGCLDVFMKTPPFDGGKKCPACKSVIYHETWKVSEKTREERWAHKQAKQRELEEVEDFLN